ncbi:hypothetical protein OUZ56_020083 [Daphnia magna]|uniref:Uncharacterized protein n=1 Tax=Daphnia magna TaxID=35525 RepID=A0ABQ9ZDI1_9CRUS|nr:hypothetical protein OUZ56_020083 [Daphnia magna]
MMYNEYVYYGKPKSFGRKLSQQFGFQVCLSKYNLVYSAVLMDLFRPTTIVFRSKNMFDWTAELSGVCLNTLQEKARDERNLSFKQLTFQHFTSSQLPGSSKV